MADGDLPLELTVALIVARALDDSERHWNDVVGILKVQTETLDKEYLARWAQVLGVADLVDRAMTDAAR